MCWWSSSTPPRSSRVLRAIVTQLIDLTRCGAVVLRLARIVQRGETFGFTDGDVIAGALDDAPVVFVESGLEFEADVRRGQKTGWFLDQRANRIAVGSIAAGQDVLDVFCATGGFSVHAAAGGARWVHSVDLSAPTLAAATRNMERNRVLPAVAACTHSVQAGDAFEVMATLAREHRRFGIVIVDPPSFAQRQASIDTARRAYTRLTHLAVRLVEPGGVLMQASCSSRVTPEALLRNGRGGRRGRRTTAVAHPSDRSRHRSPGRFCTRRVPQGWFLVGTGRLTTRRLGESRTGHAQRDGRYDSPMASVESNGITLEYTVEGEGEPLLLVMGLGAQLTDWPDEFVTGLVDVGFQVIRFDNRDIGLSTEFTWEAPSQVKTVLGMMARRPVKSEYLLADMAARRGRAARRARHRIGPRGRRVDGRDDRPDDRHRAPDSGAIAHLDHVEHRRPQERPDRREAHHQDRAAAGADRARPPSNVR